MIKLQFYLLSIIRKSRASYRKNYVPLFLKDLFKLCENLLSYNFTSNILYRENMIFHPSVYIRSMIESNNFSYGFILYG